MDNESTFIPDTHDAAHWNHWVSDVRGARTWGTIVDVRDRRPYVDPMDGRRGMTYPGLLIDTGTKLVEVVDQGGRLSRWVEDNDSPLSRLIGRRAWIAYDAYGSQGFGLSGDVTVTAADVDILETPERQTLP